MNSLFENTVCIKICDHPVTLLTYNDGLDQPTTVSEGSFVPEWALCHYSGQNNENLESFNEKMGLFTESLQILLTEKDFDALSTQSLIIKNCLTFLKIQRSEICVNWAKNVEGGRFSYLTFFENKYDIFNIAWKF